MFQLMTLAALTLAPAAPVPEVMPLQWKLNKGDVLYLSKKYSMAQIVTTAGETTKDDIIQTSFERYTILKCDKDGIEFELEIERVHFNDNYPAKKGEDLFKGMKFKIHTDSQYRVRKIEGVQDAFKTIEAAMLPGEVGLKSFVTEPEITMHFHEMFCNSPTKHVRGGDRWKSKLDVPIEPLGIFQQSREFQFDRKGNSDTFSFESESKFKLKLNEDLNKTLGIVSAEVDCTECKGLATFDSVKGRLSTLTVDIKFNGSYKVGDDDSATVKFMSTQKQEYTFTDKSMANEGRMK